MRNCGLFFCAALFFHLAGTWTLPLIDRDEPRFAEASREMLARGDYIIPYFDNRYRFDKPPFTYWMQTLSYRVFGENDFAARFPSALAATLTALLLFLWGKRMGSERLGWWAAIIFTLCLQTFVHAKAAVADMWLVLFMTAAHRAGYELLRDRLTSSSERELPPSIRWWWIFYLSLALAFLAKGPIGWTPLIAVAATRLFLSQPELSRRFLFVTGSVVMLTLVALWGVPALLRTDGEFLAVGIGKHVIERSVVAMEGHGGGTVLGYLAALPFYFVIIFLTFFPWSFKLPWLTKRLWNQRDPLDNYLLAGAGIIFLLFTLVKTKLPHYTLPAFPLVALLLAKALATERGSEPLVRRLAFVGASLGLLAALVSPFAAKFFPAYELVRQAHGDFRREMEFGGVAYREPSLIWYSRKYVDGWFNDVDDRYVPEFMAKAGPRFVVLPTTHAAALYPETPTGWKSYRTRGFSTANFKAVDVTLLLKPQ